MTLHAHVKALPIVNVLSELRTASLEVCHPFGVFMQEKLLGPGLPHLDTNTLRLSQPLGVFPLLHYPVLFHTGPTLGVWPPLFALPSRGIIRRRLLPHTRCVGCYPSTPHTWRMRGWRSQKLLTRAIALGGVSPQTMSRLVSIPHSPRQISSALAETSASKPLREDRSISSSRG